MHRPLVLSGRPLGPPHVIPKSVQRVVPHLHDLAHKVAEEDVGKEAFEKLQSLVKGDLSAKEHEAVERGLHDDEAALGKLREVALSSLSAAERKDLLLKLELFRKGKLSREEIEALFRKLRVTAAYFREHQRELERELAEYGTRKTTARRKRR